MPHFRGYDCPHCTNGSMVVNSEHLPGGRMRRYRKCVGPDHHNFATDEVVLEKVPAPGVRGHNYRLGSTIDPCPNCDTMKTVLRDLVKSARPWL